ncbi:hypothetical protein ACROYT_G002575 [Oculina patagonica]
MFSSLSSGLLLVCFATLLVTSFAADKDEINPAANTVTIRGNDTSVRIEGNTGKIRTLYFEQDDDDDDDEEEEEEEDFSDDNEDVLTFEVESLQEIDAQGMPVGMSGGPSARSHGLSNLPAEIQKFTFSPLDNSSTYKGIPVKRVNLSVPLAGPQANLKLMVFVFLREGNIDFGNETFRVQTGTMKFNIEISDWNFCGMNNETCTNNNNQNEIGQYLDMNLSIKSMAEPEEVEDSEEQRGKKPAVCVDEENPDEMDDDCPRIFKMGGNSEMLLNKGVLTGNNEYVPFPPGFPKLVTTQTSKLFTFRIPRFNNTVLLDPSVNLGPITRNPPGGGGGAGGGHNAAESLHFFSFLLLLSMFLAHY